MTTLATIGAGDAGKMAGSYYFCDDTVSRPERTQHYRLEAVDVWLFDKQSALITASRNSPTEQKTSQILLTRDGGQTWTITEPAPEVHFNNLAFADSRTGIIVGSGGEVLWTEDGGMTWRQQESIAYNLNGVALLDPQTAVAVGYGGVIYETVNGGNAWVQRISGTTELLSKVQVMPKP